jgi:hypothetical protein
VGPFGQRELLGRESLAAEVGYVRFSALHGKVQLDTDGVLIVCATQLSH